MIIREMTKDDYQAVSEIYLQGMKTLNATFESEVPSYEKFDTGHTNDCRFVSEIDGEVIGWIVLSAVSQRRVFSGVAEVSIYIHNDYKGQGIASALMERLIEESTQAGYWTLESKIFAENLASIALHKKHGFYAVGTRIKMGQDITGAWRNVVLMERRNDII